MPLADIIQRIVHFLDVGRGQKVFRTTAITLLILARLARYDIHNFRDFSSPDAMDSAQLARNIAQGRGYTTDFVRPLSIYLVRKWNQTGAMSAPGADIASLQKHPDLENPPLYPLFLAGVMKVLPFHPVIEFNKAFWAEHGGFARYQPDLLIALADQLLTLVVIAQIFFIARKVFDEEVAWVSAALVFGCDGLWELSLAGLSTMLVIVIFLALTRVLIAYEEAARAPAPATGAASNRMLMLAAAAGAMAGLGGLTLYAFGWVMVPATVFVVMNGGASRGRYGLATVAACGFVMAPWLARNYLVSGTLFGTAGFNAMAQTSAPFAGLQLEESLHPNLLNSWYVIPYFYKLLPNLADLLQNQLPRLGHSWAVFLFLAGLLLPFRGAAARHLRHFLLLCLGVFLVVQPLDHTGLADLSPGLNSENLLVIFLPLILMYAAVFFFTLFDQLPAPVMLHPNQFRYSMVVVFVLVMSLPFLGNLFSSSASPLAYPPYYPPEIRMTSTWLQKDELMMSDVPWAVAWYGDRQCIWLTRNTTDDFSELNDFLKPVSAVYLTPVTLDDKYLDDFLLGTANGWHMLAMRMYANQDTKPFPLRVQPRPGTVNSGLFLTDRPRWLAPAP